MVFDVTEDEFEQRVVERSHEVPVVVDFWAEWCGPCRQLGPALERAAEARDGDVELAKVDVDSNQQLAARFGIRGIPAVKAFRDGSVAEEFTGALPPAQVEAFFDRLVPSEADRLAASADEDEATLRRALELDPGHVQAAQKLARFLLSEGRDDEVQPVLEPFESDFVAAGLAARARLALDSDGAGAGGLAAAFAAWDRGDHATALQSLEAELADSEDPQERDLLRRAMVAIFTELGPSDPLAIEHRRRLAAVLN